MLKFEEVEYSQLTNEEFDAFADKLIYQTKEWLSFIMNTQRVRPIILRIYDGETFVGFFTGFAFKKFGLKMIGSPFKGWTTSYMGFNIKDGCELERASLIAPLWKYLKKTYHCVYCEIVDRHITEEEAKKYGLHYELQGSLMLPLGKTEEELLQGYTKHCRKHIRQFQNNPVTIESVAPTDEYAEEFYRQLTEVFSYQGLLPSYDLHRVKQLLCALKGKRDLLCTRVIENETGKWISSGISFGFNKHCYTWASTSLREQRDYNQSAGQRWFAIRHWNSLGYRDMDMEGIRGYKWRFNPEEIQIPRIMLTRLGVLIWGRNLAKKAYWVLNSLKAKFQKNR